MNEQERHESTQDTVLEGWSTWSEWLAQSGRPVERGKFLIPVAFRESPSGPSCPGVAGASLPQEETWEIRFF